jgi:uncharacterized membrane protein YbhN (UPF0104 family)
VSTDRRVEPGDEEALRRPGRLSAPARYGLRLLVAVALLTFVFSRVPLESVLSALRDTHPLGILAAYLAALGVQFLASARLQVLLTSQDVELAVREVFEINLASRFYSLFVPGGNLTGMGIRIFKVFRLGSRVAAAGAAVIADRLIATLTLCALGLVFWAAQSPPPNAIWLAVFAGCFAALAIVMWLLSRGSWPEWLERHIGKREYGDRLASLRRAVHQSGRLRGRLLGRVATLSLATHLAGIACYWLVASAMQLGLSPIEVGWVRSVMLLVTLLPISLAGLGIREAGAYLAMSFYGVEASIAVTFSVLVMLVSVLGTGLLGGLLESLRFAQRSRV